MGFEGAGFRCSTHQISHSQIVTFAKLVAPGLTEGRDRYKGQHDETAKSVSDWGRSCDRFTFLYIFDATRRARTGGCAELGFLIIF